MILYTYTYSSTRQKPTDHIPPRERRMHKFQRGNTINQLNGLSSKIVIMTTTTTTMIINTHRQTNNYKTTNIQGVSVSKRLANSLKGAPLLNVRSPPRHSLPSFACWFQSSQPLCFHSHSWPLCTPSHLQLLRQQARSFQWPNPRALFSLYLAACDTTGYTLSLVFNTLLSWYSSPTGLVLLYLWNISSFKNVLNGWHPGFLVLFSFHAICHCQFHPRWSFSHLKCLYLWTKF